MITIKTIQCNNLGENCYIVSDETKECAIIDCGASSPMEQQAISDYITAEGLTVKHHLLTHGHFDHCLGAKWVCDTYGVQPTINDNDVELYKSFKSDAATVGYAAIDYDQPIVGRCVNDGNTVEFGNTSFKVIHTPGHSRGSVVYYSQDEHTAFTGDTLFRGCIGRTDLPGGSMFQMINSLRQLQRLPENTDIYPGHGASTTMAFEGQTNPYLDM